MASTQNWSLAFILEPCKLSVTLSLSLLTLPSLFFSLTLFSFVSFFLLLPLAWTLFSIHVLCCILSRIPFASREMYEPKIDAIENQIDATPLEPECIELDCDEAPKVESSSSSSSMLEEKEKFVKELEDMDYEQFCKVLERFRSIESDGFMTGDTKNATMDQRREEKRRHVGRRN